MKKYSDFIANIVKSKQNPILLEDSWLHARAFWQKQWPFLAGLCLQNPSKPIRIYLIDPDQSLIPVLFEGLLHNLFSPDQNLEYHILTRREQPELESLFYSWASFLLDSICFEKLPDHLPALPFSSDDLLIFFQPCQQQTVVQDLQDALPHTLCWSEKPSEDQSIIKTALVLLAEQIHLSYISSPGEKNPGIAENWDSLDPYYQCSNLSSASITEVWDLLRGMFTFRNDEELHLSELEHIRWCRCLRLLATDTEQTGSRYRKMMVSFSELPPAVQQLDTRNTRWSLTFSNSQPLLENR